MERLRELATPDTSAMREVSEELASRSNPALATATAAVAPAEVRDGGGKQAAAAVAAELKADPNSRLKAADLASLLRIPEPQARELMARERDLGRLTRGSAAASLEAVRALLGLGGPDPRVAEAAGRLVAKQPRVLTVPPAELRERFGELQTLLSAPAAVLRGTLSRQPGLLTHSPELLRSRLSALGATFNVDPQLAGALALACPGLLAERAEELAGRAAALGAELRLSRSEAVALLRRHPSALLVPAGEMRSRLRALAVLLELPPADPTALGSVVAGAPRLLLLREGEAARHLEELQGLLKTSRDRALELACEQPSLLATPGPVLAERLRTFAALAKVPLQQARAVAEQRPSVLTRSSDAMRRAVAEAEAAEARAAAEAEAGHGQGPAGQGGARRG
ncbi:hypothetical protein GPECTOR_9g728 [Gonium pectorale]|uniref:Uncharacterized protein n=1 Tax=Gonium pectorale TaxID=33097 RepID=A0A150GSI8_GONPE|nr:hypothetical protein GPECTOR_9g728 [Gonium pectorale]|eukprot:KXZ52682.1 hypothetical protein GPECTOR_9g728 [Gonium pectorale]